MTEISLEPDGAKGTGKPCPPAAPDPATPQRATQGQARAVPTHPTVPDSPGGAQSQRTGGPPASVVSSNDLARLYDPEARDFAALVHAALYPRAGPNAQPDELGAFAAAWQRALGSALPPSALRTLWDKSLKEAVALGRKPDRVFKKSRGAVWTSIFNKRLANAGGRVSATG